MHFNASGYVVSRAVYLDYNVIPIVCIVPSRTTKINFKLNLQLNKPKKLKTETDASEILENSRIGFGT